MLRVPASDRSQAQKTLHWSEIAVAVQQRTLLDAKGAAYEIDRPANRIPSAAQETVVRRGLHGQLNVHQRYEFKFPQRLLDKPRFGIGA